MQFKKFPILELFDRQTTNTYKGFNADSLVVEHGETPVIVNSAKNNGISGYSVLKPNNERNVITLSDTVNSDETIFYQDKEFIGFSHVNKLIPRHLSFNKYHALYIITVLKKTIKGQYDYGAKFTSDIEHTIIKLPVENLNDTEPYWSYMESFIKDLAPKYLVRIEQNKQLRIKEIQDKQKEIVKLLGIENIEISENDEKLISELANKNWQPVRVSDIFDIIKRGKRLINAHRIEGNLPFITAGIINQGISSYISNPNIEIFPSNSITIDMFGKVYYRDFEYDADDHVAILACSDDSISKESLLFICPLIEKAIMGKFDYAQNFYASDVYDILIKLPHNGSEIDFKYMNSLYEVMVKKVIHKFNCYICEENTNTVLHKNNIEEVLKDFTPKLTQ